MKVTQIALGRFHHFHLARQMEKHNLLDKIYTGYPKCRLKDEHGIPDEKIKSFPWFHAPYMKRSVLGLDKFETLNKEWVWLAKQSLDKYVAKKIESKGVLIALSSKGLHAAKKMCSLGGKYICDRGSSHIVFQNQTAIEEHKKWGFNWNGIDKRIIEKEQQEYELADFITVPSEFALNTFIKNGVDKKKLIKIPYGARLERFRKISTPNKNKFSILWVGSVSLTKGFLYAHRAFKDFKHPNKEFIVIGAMSPEVKSVLTSERANNIIFKGTVPNVELINYYNGAQVLLFSSIDDGYGMVMAEAMACGCPVIGTYNSGAPDLITNNQDGFIIPTKSVDAIIECFEKIADTSGLREEMSEKALIKVQSFGGWDTYGSNFKALIETLT